MTEREAVEVARSDRRLPRGVLATASGALRDVWSASRIGTVVAGALQLVGALSGLLVVLASKLVLDALLSDDQLGLRAVLGLVLLAAATALSGAIGTVQQQHQRLLGERVSQLIWTRVLAASASVPLAQWNDPTFMDRLERVRGNALDRPTAVVVSLFSLLGGLLGGGALAVALLGLQPILVPVLLLAGLPAVGVSRYASRTEYAFAEQSNATARRRLYLKQLLTGRTFAAEIRAFGTGATLMERHAREDADYVRDLRRQVRRRQALGLLSTAVSALALIAAFLVIIALVDSGRMTLADAGAAAIAARLLGGQLTTTFAAVAGLIESQPFLADMHSFLYEQERDATPGQRHELKSRVEVRDVSFRYAADAPWVLRDVDLEIAAGEVVALVGENGSGKTTLAKIVAGLYEPNLGGVTWDDAPLSAADLAASVAVLFQDFVRYQMTARDNIALSRPSASVDDGEVREAAARAAILEAINTLPAGFDTLVGLELGEGTDFSGGQWQRIALARAFYRDSPLIVFDEPTAAMDPKAEHDLFADVRAVLRGRSALLISHRFSSVRLADRIYVLEDGRVIERGTHQDLMAIYQGRYAEMYQLQAAAYL